MAVRIAILGLLASSCRVTGFEIIGSGLRHTGCEELGKALEILGFKTYDSGKDLPNTHAEWMDQMELTGGDLRGAGKGKHNVAGDPPPHTQKIDPEKVVPLRIMSDRLVKEEGHKAIINSPAAFYTWELLHLYPKAKVIHTETKDSKAWFREAMLAAQLSIHRDMVMAEYHRLGKCPLPPADQDTPRCTKGYEVFNENIRNGVKKSQLLEFQISDGWEPLCKFLGVPVPNVPFPVRKKPSRSGLSTATIVMISCTATAFVALVIGAVLMSKAEPTTPSKTKGKRSD